MYLTKNIFELITEGLVINTSLFPHSDNFMELFVFAVVRSEG